MVELLLLGSVGVRRDGRDCLSVRAQPKRLALLGYLAGMREHGPVPRERLLTLFWPEASDRRARNALSQALTFLRSSLGGAIESAGAGPVCLSDDVVTDLDGFRAALTRGDDHGALELYRGEFLDGLHASCSPEFERWVEDERGGLRRLALGAARTTMERTATARDVTAAVSAGRRALAISPHDEGVLRRVLELLDAAGDRAGAVDLYRKFAERLAEDLEVEPGPDTLAVLERIRTGPTYEPSEDKGEPAKVPHTPIAEGGATTSALVPVDPPSRRAEGMSSRWASRRWEVAGAVGILAGLALGALLESAHARPGPRPVLRFALSPPDSGGFGYNTVSLSGVNIAWAPDGSRIVLLGWSETGGTQLWQWPLDQLEPQPIPGTDRARSPTVSPDGSAVAFAAGGALRTVSLVGAPPVTLVPDGVPAGGGIAWADDGRIYFAAEDGAVRSVPSAGGAVVTVATAAAGTRYRWVEALPDGRGLLLTITRDESPERSEIAAVSLAAGVVRRLFEGTMARYSTSGHVVYTTWDGTLMAAPFDRRQLEVTGPAAAFLQGVDVYAGSASQFALSRAGDLVWIGAQRGVRQVVRVDRNGVGGPVDPDWEGHFESLALSPDGSRIAVSVGPAGEELWVKELDRGPLLRLSVEGTKNSRPAWSPDGRSIAFVSNRAGPDQIWSARADGSGSAERLSGLVGSVTDPAWAPEGKAILARVRGGVVVFHEGVDSVPYPASRERFGVQYPTLSPDGRWLAFSGGGEVYVRAYPDTAEGEWQVSTGGGDEPLWARSGRELFYMGAGGDLMAVDISVEPSSALRHGVPHTLFAAGPGMGSISGARLYDVTPDDQHFVLARLKGGGRGRLMVVENFADELKARARR